MLDMGWETEGTLGASSLGSLRKNIVSGDLGSHRVFGLSFGGSLGCVDVTEYSHQLGDRALGMMFSRLNLRKFSNLGKFSVSTSLGCVDVTEYSHQLGDRASGIMFSRLNLYLPHEVGVLLRFDHSILHSNFGQFARILLYVDMASYLPDMLTLEVDGYLVVDFNAILGAHEKTGSPLSCVPCDEFQMAIKGTDLLPIDMAMQRVHDAQNVISQLGFSEEYLNIEDHTHNGSLTEHYRLAYYLKRLVTPTGLNEEPGTLIKHYFWRGACECSNQCGYGVDKGVINELSKDVTVIMDTLKREITDLSTKVNVTMVAIGNSSPPSMGMDYGRIKVLEPQVYGGARDVKELENFLFDMEQYFQVVKPMRGSKGDHGYNISNGMGYGGGQNTMTYKKRDATSTHGRPKKELKAHFSPRMSTTHQQNLRESSK
ncbi:hypothetical protein FNV43_RR18508 [Rhamnella rubrinervis]|uniref:Uncharacterized protein n=1 Tax=Rhamnella rubrinervis TaxID=2594499 RepID=A0A8K0DZI7_9ROSA|nr:hypothetical protein FNV43_RR18508 [Rhamnella rubrinervis]